MSEVQGSFFGTTPHPARVAAAAAAQCDDPGPYFDYYYTPTGQRQYRRLHCSRPAGHDGTHIHTTRLGGLLCSWGRDGKPVYPETIGGPIHNGH